MASVNLMQPFLHDAADLDDFVTLTVVAEEEDFQVLGSFKRYGNMGRTRFVSRAGDSMSMKIGIDYEDRATIDWLRAKKGRLLMYRDPVGRLVWGVFPGTSIPERIGVNMSGGFELPFTEVTYSEAV